MPSVFRNIFGGSNHNQPSSGSRSSSKSHSHSHSGSHIYTSSSPSANPNVQRSQSYSATRATAPSPLRFATGTDTRTAYGYGRRAQSYNSRTPSESRPQVLRRTSHNSRETGSHVHSSSHHTPTSSRSNSNSSMFTSMGSVPFMSSHSESGHHHGSHHGVRPPLRSNHTWHPGSSAGSASSLGSSHAHSSYSHASYAQPRQGPLHMHPLLAHSRLHRAPITYDVMFTPSARSVLDRATHSPIPSVTLSQPATDPAISSSSRLVLRSHKFPWPVIVGPSGPRFTIGPSKHSRSDVSAITNLDVLYAVHTTLLTPVTPEEWESLGHGSRAQHKVTKAYEKRCTRMGGGWEGGVRRIDWLGSKTRLVGVEVDKSSGRGGVGKLVFGKA
ncbi:unnamed protein product [Somion occarium]|uniref:DUF6699 domain-containing protein n=1 Tax=Somion occarium TaxID=3059160 RepID=A0ABP1CT76_9APHY